MLPQSVTMAVVVAILITQSVRCYSLAKFNRKDISMRMKINSDLKSRHNNVNDNIESQMVPGYMFQKLLQEVVSIDKNLKILESNVSTISKLINQINISLDPMAYNDALQNMTSIITDMRNETNLEFMKQKNILKHEIDKCNEHYDAIISIFAVSIAANNIAQKKFFTETNAEQTRLLSDILKMQSQTEAEIKCLNDTVFVMKWQLWSTDNKVIELKKLIKDVVYDVKHVNNTTKPKIFSFKMIITLFLLTLTSVLQPEIRSGARFIINRIKSII